MDKKSKAIDVLINKWFKQKVIKNNKEVYFKLKVVNKNLKLSCMTLKSDKFFKSIPMQNFVSDYILNTYLAMNIFPATSNEWLAMAENEEDNRIDELERYINVSVKKMMKRAKMEDNGTIMKINNKDELVTLPFLNLEIIGESENEEVNILDFLTSDSNIFYHNKNQIYYQNAFRKWFDENREKILTKNQDRFIANLNNVNMTEQDNDTVRSFVGIDKFKVNTKLDGIVDRIVKAYNEQLPKLESRETLELKSRIELLQPVTSLIYSDEENVNRKIFDYVSGNFERLQEYLKLSAEENRALIRNEYDTQIVYKVAEQLETNMDIYKSRLKQAKVLDVKTVDEYAKFVHKKVEHESDEMDVYEIIGRDGLMYKKDKDDPHPEDKTGILKIQEDLKDVRKNLIEDYRKGEPVVLEIESTGGTLVSSETQLITRAFQGTIEVTERFHNWKWERDSKSQELDAAFNEMLKHTSNSSHLTVYHSDLFEKESVFRVTLYDDDNKVIASAFVSLAADMKVEDIDVHDLKNMYEFQYVEFPSGEKELLLDSYGVYTYNLPSDYSVTYPILDLELGARGDIRRYITCAVWANNENVSDKIDLIKYVWLERTRNRRDSQVNISDFDIIARGSRTLELTSAIASRKNLIAVQIEDEDGYI